MKILTDIHLVTPVQTAEILGVVLGTLSVWRCTRRYNLPFVKIGRKVFYRGSDIQSFIESRTIGALEESVAGAQK